MAKLITPERNQQFRQKLETMALEMMRSGDRKRQEMGMKLNLAASTLDSWELGRHPLLYDVYVYQAEQMEKQGQARGASPDQETQFRRLLAKRGARS